MTELIGKNSVKLDLPHQFNIHPVVHARHTMPFSDQPSDISQQIDTKPLPVPNVGGEKHEVGRILRHRPLDRGFQFINLMKGAPLHDLEWKPTRDFFDADGTVTAFFQE